LKELNGLDFAFCALEIVTDSENGLESTFNDGQSLIWQLLNYEPKQRKHRFKNVALTLIQVVRKELS